MAGNGGFVLPNMDEIRCTGLHLKRRKGVQAGLPPWVVGALRLPSDKQHTMARPVVSVWACATECSALPQRVLAHPECGQSKSGAAFYTDTHALRRYRAGIGIEPPAMCAGLASPLTSGVQPIV